MMLVMMLVKRNCLILVSIVEKPTTLKIFVLNRDINFLNPRINPPLNNKFLFVPILFNQVNLLLLWNGMDYGASNHMFSTSLFYSYDTHKHTSHKVYISDGNKILVVHSGNAKVPNDTLEYVFHVHDMPINIISIYRSCQKGYEFEAWPDKYALKDIKHKFKVVSSSLVDQDSSLYKFIGFQSTKNQPFYSYVVHVYEESKLWHERLGHLNYGKMKML
jgi:hypothetical protein